MLKPFRRNALGTAGHDHDASDNGACRVSISQTADCGPERIFITREMTRSTPQGKGHRVGRRYSRAISKFCNCRFDRRMGCKINSLLNSPSDITLRRTLVHLFQKFPATTGLSGFPDSRSQARCIGNRNGAGHCFGMSMGWH